MWKKKPEKSQETGTGKCLFLAFENEHLIFYLSFDQFFQVDKC